MARANVIQTNFTSGEVSPLMYGRVDVNKYFNGARKLQNMIVRPQGGAWRRSGTRFVKAAKLSNAHSILQSFIFSDIQTYVLEFGASYMRVYKDRGYIETSPGSGVQVEISTPWAAADLDQLYFIQSADVLYVSHPSYQTRKITRTSHTAWTISLYSPTDGPYLVPDSSVARMTLSGITDSSNLFIQSGAAVFAAGDVGKYVEWKENGKWRFGVILTFVNTKLVTVDQIDTVMDPNIAAEISFTSPNINSDLTGIFTTQDKGKYIRTTTTGVWYHLTGYVGSSRMTATVVTTMYTYTYPTSTMVKHTRTISATLTATLTGAAFTTNDVGRVIRLVYGVNVVVATITAFTSATVVSVTIDEVPPPDPENADNLYNNATADEHRYGGWYVGNWPSINTFHEQRLFFGKTTLQPQTVWGSRSGDYENMAPTEDDLTVVADNAVNYTLASNKANPLCWMESGPVMLIGTAGAEHQMKATALNQPITPTNIDTKEQTSFGSQSTHRPHRIGSSVLYLQRGGNKLREMTYNFQIDAFESKDLNILAEHILRRGTGGFRSTFQKEPVIVVWMILNNGNLAAMTYERDQDVVAWSSHIIGGSGIVESICCVPTTSGPDDVYLMVKRTVNGSECHYVEYIENAFDTDVSGVVQSSMFFVDCGLSYSGSPATTISGLTHLVGETVQVLADGIYIGTKVVSGGGTITLTTAASKVHVGYKTTATIVTLDPEGGSQAGTSQGKVKRISVLTARLKDSMPFKHGPDEQHLTKINQSDFTALKTGDVRFTLDQGFGLSGSYVISQDEPVALNVTALMPQLNTNE